MKPMIYFYIPVRNEQGTAGVLLYRLMESMRAVDMEYEVHLTLDGCTDDSVAVVEPYMKKLPITVTHNESRLGYGKCLNEAIRKVSGSSQNPKRDFFVVLDADFSVDPAEIKEMAAGIERNVVLYLPDRLSVAKNKIGLAKRIANTLAAKLLRRRGASFPKHVDLLSTFRACRVHHLRRNLPRLEALSVLPVSAPPAVSGALLFLALQDNSKKTEMLEIREQHMTRRKSRFSLFGVIRNLLFGPVVEKVISDSEGKRDDKGSGRSRSRGSRDSSRSSRSRRPDTRRTAGEDKKQGDEQRSGAKRSRGGRSRRGRRAGGASASGQAASQAAQQQQDAKQKSGKQEGRKEEKRQGAEQQGDKKSQADSAKGEGSSSSRSRRRRRRPNKRSQDSSNKPQDNKSAD